MESNLIRAIKRRDHSALNAAIQSAGDLEYADSQGWTPLFHAAHRGDVVAIRMLLEAGADVNRGIGQGFTALFSAVMGLHLEAVKVLLDAGAKPVPVQGVALQFHVQRRDEQRSQAIIAVLNESALKQA